MTKNPLSPEERLVQGVFAGKDPNDCWCAYIDAQEDLRKARSAEHRTRRLPADDPMRVEAQSTLAAKKEAVKAALDAWSVASGRSIEELREEDLDRLRRDLQAKFESLCKEDV